MSGFEQFLIGLSVIPAVFCVYGVLALSLGTTEPERNERMRVKGQRAARKAETHE